MTVLAGQVQATALQTPLVFEENRGQAPPEVRYLARGGGYTVLLTAREALLLLRPVRYGGRASGALSLRLDGAAQRVRLDAIDELPGKSNYLIGRDPAQWRTGIPNFSKVTYSDVYPGIDLVYYGRERQLESDLIVRPGADPARIRLAFDGAESVKPATNGDLIVHLRGGDLRLEKPTVYQGSKGARHEIASRYVVDRRGRVGVRMAAYDRARPLVIDPVLSFSTYLGGRLEDSANGIAVDPDGNVYVTGQTASIDFPTYPNRLPCPRFAIGCPYNETNAGGSDVFVTKLVPFQSHFMYGYSTYIGGSEDDFANAVAVDATGHAYVTGQTLSTSLDDPSTDFPTTAGALQTDPAGGTCTTTCPDAFVLKLDASGSRLVYSTFLGGIDSAAIATSLQAVAKFDAGNGIAVDSWGNAYVTGQTQSGSFPHTLGALRSELAAGNCGTPPEPCPDAFVTKLSATGSELVFSTYLGGSGEDHGNAIAVDVEGQVYVTGQTASADFPVCDFSFGIPVDRRCPHSILQDQLKGVSDAFVTKLGADGRLVYSTYLGGADGQDGGNGIAVRSVTRILHGIPRTTTNAYVTGFTNSADFPVVNAFQGVYGGYGDVFVAELSEAGTSLVYSTFLGGSNGFGNLPSEAGNAIAVDAAGNAYVTGYTRATTNAIAPDGLPFPAPRPLAEQPSCIACAQGGEDAFVAKLDPDGSLSYATYLGGTDPGYNDNVGRAIALDASGNAWVAGSTTSQAFPRVHPTDNTGSQSEGFVSRLVDPTEGSAGLAVTQTASPEPAVEGADLTYTLTVVNNGPDGASNVALIESLAPEVTFVSASASQGGCAPALGKQVICNLGDLAAGAQPDVTVVVRPNRKGP